MKNCVLLVGPFLEQRCLQGGPLLCTRWHGIPCDWRQPPSAVVRHGIPWTRRLAVDLDSSVCRQAVQRCTCSPSVLQRRALKRTFCISSTSSAMRRGLTIYALACFDTVVIHHWSFANELGEPIAVLFDAHTHRTRGDRVEDIRRVKPRQLHHHQAENFNAARNRGLTFSEGAENTLSQRTTMTVMRAHALSRRTSKSLSVRQRIQELSLFHPQHHTTLRRLLESEPATDGEDHPPSHNEDSNPIHQLSRWCHHQVPDHCQDQQPHNPPANHTIVLPGPHPHQQDRESCQINDPRNRVDKTDTATGHIQQRMP